MKKMSPKKVEAANRAFEKRVERNRQMATPREIRPKHYKRGGMEAWDVIEAFNLNFNTGNAFKYISRYNDKMFLEDKIKDLVKASTYINRELKLLKARIFKPNLKPCGSNEAVFVTGAVSPCLQARIDLDKYHSMISKKLKNFIPRKGNVPKRKSIFHE